MPAQRTVQPRQSDNNDRGETSTTPAGTRATRTGDGGVVAAAAGGLVRLGHSATNSHRSRSAAVDIRGDPLRRRGGRGANGGGSSSSSSRQAAPDAGHEQESSLRLALDHDHSNLGQLPSSRRPAHPISSSRSRQHSSHAENGPTVADASQAEESQDDDPGQDEIRSADSARNSGSMAPLLGDVSTVNGISNVKPLACDFCTRRKVSSPASELFTSMPRATAIAKGGHLKMPRSKVTVACC